MSNGISKERWGSLPRRGHVVLPGLPAGANVAVCERGTHGVRMTTIDLGEFAAARRLVRALNDALGIDAAAEHAMLVGCLRSWDSVMAAPGFPRARFERFMSDMRIARQTSVLH
jgi:hypothetical protein